MALSNPFTMDKCVDRSVRMLQRMVNPTMVDVDKQIPATLLRHCEGVAFVKIFKAGLFFLGGNMGGGCIIAKVRDPEAEKGWKWSAPVSIGCAGLGGGFVFGGEAIDSIVILNTRQAVKAFMGKGQITFGGNVSLAVGPVGRDIEAHVGASDNAKFVAAYSYSQAKGAYIGGTLEGAVMMIRDEENVRYYGTSAATAENLLTGKFTAPFKAMVLANELDSILNRRGDYRGLPSSKSMFDMSPKDSELARSGRDLVKRGLSSSELGAALPPGWEAFKTEDGSKTYYHNAALNLTQWEPPAAAAASAPAPVAPVAAAVAVPSIPPRPSIPSRPAAPLMVTTALYPYTATQPDETNLSEGDRVEVLQKVDENWWKARVNGKIGLVPATYLKQ